MPNTSAATLECAQGSNSCHAIPEPYQRTIALRNRLNCCVQFVHHTGKQNARDKTVDQYSGRNGSAMPDGARMVAVMQPMTPEEWEEAAGFPLTDGETGIRLALPKLTWCSHQPDILIRRSGYTFQHFTTIEHDPQRIAEARLDQIVLFLDSEAKAGRHHTQNTLQECRQTLSMSRDQVREAVAMLIAAGRLRREDRRSGESGGAHTCLGPRVLSGKKKYSGANRREQRPVLRTHRRYVINVQIVRCASDC